MREIFAEPGIVSVRTQIGIETEDRRVFRPYTVDEAIRAAAVIRRAGHDAQRREDRGSLELVVGAGVKIYLGHVDVMKLLSPF